MLKEVCNSGISVSFSFLFLFLIGRWKRGAIALAVFVWKLFSRLLSTWYSDISISITLLSYFARLIWKTSYSRITEPKKWGSRLLMTSRTNCRSHWVTGSSGKWILKKSCYLITLARVSFEVYLLVGTLTFVTSVFSSALRSPLSTCTRNSAVAMLLTGRWS